MARVTILLPMWNKADLTRSMLNKLCNQTSKDFSVIVIDDGSSEPFSIEEYKDYPFNVTSCRSTTNEGCSRALQKGIALSLVQNSDIVGCINNDIDISDNLVEELTNVLSDDIHAACPYFEGVRHMFKPDDSFIYGFQGLCFFIHKKLYLERYLEFGYFLDPAYRYSDCDDLDIMQWLVSKNCTSIILRNCTSLNNQSASTCQVPKNLKQINKDYYKKKWPNPKDHQKLFTKNDTN